jgi:hypothetical protein
LVIFANFNELPTIFNSHSEILASLLDVSITFFIMVAETVISVDDGEGVKRRQFT